MTQLRCSCGEIIGTTVQVGRERWLEVGGAQLQYFRGRCSKCKLIIYFNSLDGRLSDLLENVRQLRSKSTEKPSEIA